MYTGVDMAPCEEAHLGLVVGNPSKSARPHG